MITRNPNMNPMSNINPVRHDPGQYLAWHMNNYFSTPQGQKMAKTSFKNYPALQAIAMARGAMHTNIMNGLKNNMGKGMALDEDHSLLSPPPNKTSNKPTQVI